MSRPGCNEWDRERKRVSYAPIVAGRVDDAKKLPMWAQGPATELSFEEIAGRIEDNPERGRLWDILSEGTA